MRKSGFWWCCFVVASSLWIAPATSPESQAAEITADNRLTIQGGTGGAELRMISDLSTGNEARYFLDNYTNRLEVSCLKSSNFTIPMTIHVGTPNDSLVLTSNGVRIGTQSTANAGTLQIFDIVNPAIRLEDSDSNQSFEIGSTDSGLYIFDTNSSTAPFSISAQALDAGLYLDNGGNLGVGTFTPGTLLHTLKPHGSNLAESIARFEIDDDAVGRLEVNNATTTNGTFIPRLQGRAKGVNAALIMEAIIAQDTGSNPAIVYNTLKTSAGGPSLTNRPMVAYRNNNVAKVTVFADGQISATAFNVSSSRAVKNDIVNLDSQAAANALRELTPVEFTYKADELGERYVGFVAEDVPELVASADRKSVPIMDVVAVLTRVVKDQQQSIESREASLQQQSLVVADQQKTFDEQTATLDQLKQRLTRLKSRMQNDQ